MELPGCGTLTLHSTCPTGIQVGGQGLVRRCPERPLSMPPAAGHVMCRLEGGLVRSPGWTGECRTFADPCRRVGLPQGLSEASGSFHWEDRQSELGKGQRSGRRCRVGPQRRLGSLRLWSLSACDCCGIQGQILSPLGLGFFETRKFESRTCEFLPARICCGRGMKELRKGVHNMCAWACIGMCVCVRLCTCVCKCDVM